MDKLSITMESYLDSIFELSENGENDCVRLKDIADKIGVTKSTANAAMTALAENNLIQNERYRQIQLTESGIEMAKTIAKKHEIIKRYFSEVLNINPNIADKDACTIEHVISGVALEAMQKYLTDKSNG
jgi:DtxR family Mn-dependent transcriptional regulator